MFPHGRRDPEEFESTPTEEENLTFYPFDDDFQHPSASQRSDAEGIRCQMLRAGKLPQGVEVFARRAREDLSFILQNPHSGSKESTRESCPLIATLMCVYTHNTNFFKKMKANC